MTDHTIEAHFTMDSLAGVGRRVEVTQEDRVVKAMVDAVCPPEAGQFARIQAEQVAKTMYRMMNAMNEALANEA